MRAAALLWTTSILGCGAAPRPSLPIAPEAHSLIVSRDGALEAHAVNAGLAYEVDAVQRLTVLTYAPNLANLDLQEGVLTSGEVCRSCALVEPLQTFNLTSPDFVATQVSDVPEEVMEALLPDHKRCGLCRDFSSSPFELPPTSRPDRRPLIKAGEDRVLVVSFEGLTWVDRQNSSLQAACQTSTVVSFRCASPEHAGRVALGTSDGRAWVIELDKVLSDRPCRDAVALETSALGTPLVAIELFEDTESLVVTTTVGSVFRWGGEQWQDVGAFSEPDNEFHAGRGPSGDIYVVNGSPSFARVTPSEVEWLTASIGGQEARPTAVRTVAPFGLVFGTQNHGTLVPLDAEGRLESLGGISTFSDDRVDAIAPYGENGLMTSRRRGGVVEIGSGGRECGRTQLEPIASFEDVVTFSDGSAMVSFLRGWLLRPSPSPECPSRWSTLRTVTGG